MILDNIAALARLGCHIDLDDFGTGQASINALRRLPVRRLKIDRSFVTGLDRDPQQRRILCGILSLAERLGIETLAEGVEHVGEHALLSQLGCDHVQGFAIARPMPAEDVPGWIAAQNARVAGATRLSRQAQ